MFINIWASVPPVGLSRPSLLFGALTSGDLVFLEPKIRLPTIRDAALGAAAPDLATIILPLAMEVIIILIVVGIVGLTRQVFQQLFRQIQAIMTTLLDVTDHLADRAVFRGRPAAAVVGRHH